MTRSVLRRIAPVLGAALIATGITGAAQAEGLFQTQTRALSRTMAMAEARLSKSFGVLDRKQIRERTRTQTRAKLQTRAELQDRTMTQTRTRTQEHLTVSAATQQRSRDAVAGATAAGHSGAGVGAGAGNGSAGRN